MPESDRVFRALKLTVLVIGIPPTVRREVMLRIPARVGMPRRKVSARPAVPILIFSLEHIPPATFFSLIGVYLLLAVYAVVCIVGLHRLYYGLHLPLSNLIFLVVGLSALPGYLVYNITRHFGALIKITYEVVALPKEDQPEESAE